MDQVVAERRLWTLQVSILAIAKYEWARRTRQCIKNGSCMQHWMTRSSSDIHFYLKIMRFSESSSKNTPKQVCHHPTLKCIKRYQDNLSNIIHPPTAQVIATLPNVTQVQVRALHNHKTTSSRYSHPLGIKFLGIRVHWRMLKTPDSVNCNILGANQAQDCQKASVGALEHHK